VIVTDPTNSPFTKPVGTNAVDPGFTSPNSTPTDLVTGFAAIANPAAATEFPVEGVVKFTAVAPVLVKAITALSYTPNTGAFAFNRTLKVPVTEPLDGAKLAVAPQVVPLSEDTSNPAGAVATIGAVKSVPETENVCTAEATP
jgi:hypothetical protein